MKNFNLDNVPKIQTGFTTPDDYFDTFATKMMAQLPKHEPKVISIFQKRKTTIMMVAAVAVIALMIPFLMPSDTSSADLDAAALENYITYQSNVNQYDLLNGLETEDLKKINNRIVLEDETIEEHFSVNTNLENLILE